MKKEISEKKLIVYLLAKVNISEITRICNI